MVNKKIRKMYNGKYIELTPEEAKKELEEFLDFMRAVKLTPYPKEKLEPYSRAATALIAVAILSLFIVPVLIVQTSNSLVLLLFPILFLLYRGNSRIIKNIFEKESSSAFLEWRDKSKSETTLQYLLISKARLFGLYHTLNKQVGVVKKLLAQLSGDEDSSIWDKQEDEKVNVEPTEDKKLSYEEEWIMGVEVFLELIQELPNELRTDNVVLQIPVKPGVKPIFSRKASIASSHLLIKTDHSLYGIKILGGSFQATELG